MQILGTPAKKVIKSKQSGTIIIPKNATSVTLTIANVNVNATIVKPYLVAYATSFGGTGGHCVTPDLINETTIVFSRSISNTNWDMKIEYEVEEYNNVKSKQVITDTPTGYTQDTTYAQYYKNRTITSVNKDKVVKVDTLRNTESAGNTSDSFTHSRYTSILTTNTNLLEKFSAIGGTYNIYFNTQILEFK